MIGHQVISNQLKNLNVQGILGHGYIFHGPTMVGKKTAALEFAKFLESAGAGEIQSSKTLSDMMLIEADENNSIGIDAVREIKNFLWQKPNVSVRRTLIINDAELLTTEAQNALLKVTEEPPISSLLILITSDTEAILPTIVSRLPKIYFGTVREMEIAKWIGDPKTTKKAMGKPGLAWRLLHDKELEKQIELAEKLLKTPVATRRDLLKKIIEPDEFNFRKFLDAILLQLAWGNKTKATMELWHAALQLYDRETNFSLNPRLQMEALLL
jgi:DNA polymerase III delta prime subunit